MPTSVREALDEAYTQMGLPEDEQGLEPLLPPEEPEQAAEDDAVDTPEEGTDEHEAAEGEQTDRSEQELAEDQPEGEATEEQPTEEDVEGSTDSQVIEIPESEDVILKLDDGTEVPAREAVLRQKDYTQKTQATAEERRELEEQREEIESQAAEVQEAYDELVDWWSERQSNPSGFVRDMVTESANPTQTLARAIKELVDEDALDPEFVQTFGLEANEVVDRNAEQAEYEDRIAALEEQQLAQEERQQQLLQQQEKIDEYRRQWQSIKAEHGLTFESRRSEQEVAEQLLKIADERGIEDLETAYAVMVFENGEPQQNQTGSEQATAEKRSGSESKTKQKRATRAMAKKSAGNSSRKTPQKAESLRGAAEMALDQFVTGG